MSGPRSIKCSESQKSQNPRFSDPKPKIRYPNRVAMPRHGLILSQHGATSLRKVSRYLPGLRDTILCPKMIATDKMSKNIVILAVFVSDHYKAEVS